MSPWIYCKVASSLRRPNWVSFVLFKVASVFPFFSYDIFRFISVPLAIFVPNVGGVFFLAHILFYFGVVLFVGEYPWYRARESGRICGEKWWRGRQQLVKIRKIRCEVEDSRGCLAK